MDAYLWPAVLLMRHRDNRGRVLGSSERWRDNAYLDLTHTLRATVYICGSLTAVGCCFFATLQREQEQVYRRRNIGRKDRRRKKESNLISVSL